MAVRGSKVCVSFGNCHYERLKGSIVCELRLLSLRPSEGVYSVSCGISHLVAKAVI